MKTFTCLVLASLFELLLIPSNVWAQGFGALDPARVLVVFNQNTPDQNGNGLGDSQEVALAYQVKRGVPASHLLGVSCSTNQFYYGGLSGWTAFYTEVRDPVVQFLNTHGQLSIDTILFCHGVPYRLSLPAANGGARSLDQAMMTPYFLGSSALPAFPQVGFSSPYFEGSPGFGSDQGHFDHTRFFAGTPLYLVARLDGPDVDTCLDLIEGALYGDRYISSQTGFYHGNIYVDTRFGSYPNLSALPYPQYHAPSYANADQDMAWCTQLMTPSGFPLLWENTSGSLEIGEPGATYQTGAPALTAPDALFYYGWYNYNTYHDVWSWLPGSAASDLDSNSAANIHNPSPNSFLANAFQRGLTCGVGSIAEPYLSWHPFPEVFIYYMLSGYTFAEAAAVSDQTQQWRNLYVGDPLYCPLRQGKPLVMDTSAPPVPEILAGPATSTSRSFDLRIDTTGGEPDLVVLSGSFGAAPVLGQSLGSDAHFSLSKGAMFNNLVSGAFYRALLVLHDPVGNTTNVPELLFFSAGGSAPLAQVQADHSTASVGEPLTLELALRSPGGLAAVSGFSVTVDVPQYGIGGLDLVPMLPYLSPVVHGDPLQGEVLSLELLFSSGLPAGSFTFNFSITTPGGPAQGSWTIAVN